MVDVTLPFSSEPTVCDQSGVELVKVEPEDLDADSYAYDGTRLWVRLRLPEQDAGGVPLGWTDPIETTVHVTMRPSCQ